MANATSATSSWCKGEPFGPGGGDGGDLLSDCFALTILAPLPSAALLLGMLVAALCSLCAPGSGSVQVEGPPKRSRPYIVASVCITVLGASAVASLLLSMGQAPAAKLAPVLEAFASAFCGVGMYKLRTRAHSRQHLGIGAYGLAEAATTAAVALLSTQKAAWAVPIALGRVLVCCALSLALLWPAIRGTRTAPAPSPLDPAHIPRDNASTGLLRESQDSTRKTWEAFFMSSGDRDGASRRPDSHTGSLGSLPWSRRPTQNTNADDIGVPYSLSGPSTSGGRGTGSPPGGGCRDAGGSSTFARDGSSGFAITPSACSPRRLGSNPFEGERPAAAASAAATEGRGARQQQQQPQQQWQRRQQQQVEEGGSSSGPDHSARAAVSHSACWRSAGFASPGAGFASVVARQPQGDLLARSPHTLLLVELLGREEILDHPTRPDVSKMHTEFIIRTSSQPKRFSCGQDVLFRAHDGVSWQPARVMSLHEDETHYTISSPPGDGAPQAARASSLKPAHEPPSVIARQRYSSFERLHSQLLRHAKRVPSSAPTRLPPLPPKMATRTLEALDARQLALESWLRRVVVEHRCDELRVFLGLLPEVSSSAVVSAGAAHHDLAWIYDRIRQHDCGLKFDASTDTFRGSQLVEWLISQALANSREEGTRTAEMMRVRGLIESAAGPAGFRDGRTRYRLVPLEWQTTRAADSAGGARAAAHNPFDNPF